MQNNYLYYICQGMILRYPQISISTNYNYYKQCCSGAETHGNAILASIIFKTYLSLYHCEQ